MCGAMFNVNCGVPQGSDVGPLLLSLDKNETVTYPDIFLCVKNGKKGRHFENNQNFKKLIYKLFRPYLSLLFQIHFL